MTTAEPGCGALEGGAHVFPLRVYYEDTDAAGIVYYANYLRFAERARTEMLRALGVDPAALREVDGVAFAVRRCEVDYLRPARLDETLAVHTGNLRLEGAGLWADQVVRRGREEIARLRVRLACIGRSGRPVRMPPGLRAALGALAGAQGSGSGARGRANATERD